MFGIVRPCRHRLSEDLRNRWTAHLCGLCLALRGDHGQFARTATNYDGLIVSVLAEAQSEERGGGRRTAGPCPLRGMRTASVAHGEGARLAAAVSLVLASAKMRDHVADRDGLLARRPVAAAARRVAAAWGRAGARTGAELGFDTGVLVRAVDRQQEIEDGAGPGTPLLEITEPTETATAAAFGHTAVLVGRSGNAAPLGEAGRLFGRLAHLLDAVEDRADDAAAGAWNPLTATGAGLAEARGLCDGAVRGIRLALKETEFADGELAHLLLAHELSRSVDRAFGAACAHQPVPGNPYAGSGDPPGRAAGGGEPGGYGAPGQPYGPGASGSGGHGSRGGHGDHGAEAGHGGHGGRGGPGGGGGGHGGRGGPGGPGGGPYGPPPPPPGPRYPRKRGPIAGCAVWTGLFCTCQVCCRDTYDDPWRHHKKRAGWGDACDCCSCDC